MSDLSGKVAVITGANSGIGLEAAVALAKRGCAVVMCCRNMEKSQVAYQDLLTRSGALKECIFLCQLDLADLDNVGTFRARYDAIPFLAQRPVDMLILNAGVMAPSSRQVTKQNVEVQFGTNVLGHFKFTFVMMDKCAAATNCRIVCVSSVFNLVASGINLGDLPRTVSYNKWTSYMESKLANLVFMHKLNRVLEEHKLDHVVAVGCHPGYSSTNLQSESFFSSLNFVAQSAVQGAEPTVLAATDLSAPRNSYAGPYYIYRGPATWNCKMSSLASRVDLQEDLWEKCVEVTGCDIATKL